MKKNYILLLIAILFCGMAIAQTTQKNFINYQGVARNAGNELMASEDMTIRIALGFGGAGAPAVYEEDHNIITDANGVFSLLIGNGSAASSDYNALPWGSMATFVTVTMNGNEIGTTEMMAVPYAISSGDADDQSAAEVLYNNTASGLAAANTQEAIDELVGRGAVDADADPTNEFQTLGFDTATNELSLSNGNTVTIPSGGADADADPTNEIQTISFDIATNELSLTDGGVVTIPSGGTDADADPTNEFQNLSFDAATNELSLTDGNTVTIPSGGTDADADPTNEIDVTNQFGILMGDDGLVSGLVGTVDGQVVKWDDAATSWVAGTDATGGAGGSSLWSEDGADIYFNTGNVGIGIDRPRALQHLHSGSARTNLHFTNGASGNITTDGLQIGLVNSLGLGLTGYVMNEENGPLQLGTNSTTRVFITKDGNVGINTFVPAYRLDVDGDIRSIGLSGTGQRNVMADADGKLVIGAGGGSLWAEDGNGINYSSGNVGIGESSPNYPLQVATDSERPINLSSSNEDNYIAFNNSTGYVGYTGVFNGDRDMDFGTGFLNGTGSVHLVTNAFPKLTVVADGKVGIGTTNPTAKLDVDGDIKTSGEVHGADTGNANMLPIAYGRVEADGTITSGTGNFVVNRNIEGNYLIVITGQTNNSEWVIVANSLSGLPRVMSIGYFPGAERTFSVVSWGLDSARADTRFSFIVYKR